MLLTSAQADATWGRWVGDFLVILECALIELTICLMGVNCEFTPDIEKEICALMIAHSLLTQLRTNVRTELSSEIINIFNSHSHLLVRSSRSVRFIRSLNLGSPRHVNNDKYTYRTCTADSIHRGFRFYGSRASGRIAPGCVTLPCRSACTFLCSINELHLL